MERFVKGDVVVVSFPFSNLSNAKRRPALVLSDLQGDDVVLCQITSQFVRDAYAISLGFNDFEVGRLHKASNIRPNRLFTAEKSIIIRKVGRVKSNILTHTIDTIIQIIAH